MFGSPKVHHQCLLVLDWTTATDPKVNEGLVDLLRVRAEGLETNPSSTDRDLEGEITKERLTRLRSLGEAHWMMCQDLYIQGLQSRLGNVLTLTVNTG